MIGRSDGGYPGGVLTLSPDMLQRGARPGCRVAVLFRLFGRAFHCGSKDCDRRRERRLIDRIPKATV
jgi:hypothetical protein